MLQQNPKTKTRVQYSSSVSPCLPPTWCRAASTGTHALPPRQPKELFTCFSSPRATDDNTHAWAACGTPKAGSTGDSAHREINLARGAQSTKKAGALRSLSNSDALESAWACFRSASQSAI